MNELLAFRSESGELIMTRLYRYLGAVCAWGYARVGISPNSITLISSILATTGALVLLIPDAGIISPQLALTAFGLQVLGYASDCSDGQLARATGKSSALGKWLDHVSDAWKILLIHFCFGWVGLQMAAASGISLHWAFLAMALNLAGSLLYYFGWNYKVMIAGNDLLGTQMNSSRLKALCKLPLQLTEFGVFLLLFPLACLRPHFLWIYFLYGAFQSLVAFLYLAATIVALRRR